MGTFEILYSAMALIKLMPEMINKTEYREIESKEVWNWFKISRRTFYGKMKKNSFTIDETINYIMRLDAKGRNIDNLFDGKWQIIEECKLEILHKKRGMPTR